MTITYRQLLNKWRSEQATCANYGVVFGSEPHPKGWTVWVKIDKGKRFVFIPYVTTQEPPPPRTVLTFYVLLSSDKSKLVLRNITIHEYKLYSKLKSDLPLQIYITQNGRTIWTPKQTFVLRYQRSTCPIVCNDLILCNKRGDPITDITALSRLENQKYQHIKVIGELCTYVYVPRNRLKER